MSRRGVEQHLGERSGWRHAAEQPLSGAAVMHAPQAGIRSIFRRFWPAIRPYRGRLLISLLLVDACLHQDPAQRPTPQTLDAALAGLTR